MTSRDSEDDLHNSNTGALDATHGATARVLAVRVGPCVPYAFKGRFWTSAITKYPRDGPVWACVDGLIGDQHGDTRVHGGADKALFCYPAAHYAYWRRDLALPELSPGAFGENLVLEGADENDAHIGDVVRIGSALAQVSQPRRPCWRPVGIGVARTWLYALLPPG